MAVHTNEPDDALASTGWLVFLVAVLAVVGIAQVAILPTNGDEAWHLYMAERVLDGARPYVDIVETNPPLITLLNMAVVLLARGLGLSCLTMFSIVSLVMIGFSLALSWRLSRGLPLGLRQVSLVTWAYLLFLFAFLSYGQREHLLLILMLPYAYAAIAEGRGDRLPPPLALTVGLMAGVGFAIKPFFVPTMAAVEVFLALRRGPRVWLRPTALMIGVVLLAYTATLAIWTPQYFAIAREYAAFYPHHGPSGPMLLASSWRLPLVVAAVVLGWVVGRQQAPGWGEVFGILAGGFMAVVYLTGKGWSYHWIPPCSVAIAQFCGGLALASSRLSARRRHFLAVAGLGMVAPALAGLSLISAVSFWQDTEPTRVIRNHVGRGDSVLVLSPWLTQSFPMINETGVGWGMRHPMVWQIAAFYKDGSFLRSGYHDLDAMSDSERKFVGEVAADFARNRPALLMIDDCPPRPSLPGFDYLRYFAREPRFSQTLADYEPLTRTLNFRVYSRKKEHGTGLSRRPSSTRSTERSLLDRTG